MALRPDLREELTGKKFLWDPVAFRIANSDESNQFLRPENRAGRTI